MHTLPIALALLITLLATTDAARASEPEAFDADKDLISLHYDHAPDQDDGHSAAADRTVLDHLHSPAWIKRHTVAVSGAYGTNANTFNPDSDAVMQAVWAERGGWLDAHKHKEAALDKLTRRWRQTLDAGGRVWVKEGGQSDITAQVLRRLQDQAPGIDLKKQVIVVQHSDWNENKTTEAALAFTKEHAHYVRIRDANALLNVSGGDAQFQSDALRHPTLGESWRAAFHYYDPGHRLDFSDTGELLRILGLGEIGINEFRERFLQPGETDA